jgi:hypothetical protein
LPPPGTIFVLFSREKSDTPHCEIFVAGISFVSCLLINPPLVKPSEPPPGIARLAGALEAGGVSCTVLDANIEGILHLLHGPVDDSGNDTWTRRARRHLPKALKELQTPETFKNHDRYRRAVMDINRVLQLAARSSGVSLSLADYHDEHLSPVRSADCLRSFANPETNPFYSYFEERIPPLLDEARPDVVGLSLNFLSQALTTFALAGYIRRIDPGLKIIVGGGLATSWKRSPAWSDPFRDVIDLWVDGPGEGTLPGLFGKSAGDRLFPPRYKGFPLHRYLSPGPVLPYDASRGCWWLNCSFCPERAEGNRYRPVPPETVTNDLRKLVDDHDPALIHLVDNALSPALLRELVKTPPGAPWYGFARFTADLDDPAFCRELKRAGCAMLKLGLESGSPAVLEKLGKGIDLDQASRTLAYLKEAGIAAYVYLLFGTPEETIDDAEKTKDFVARHARNIGFLNLAIFNLPAWSDEARTLGCGSFYEGDLVLYRTFVHPRGWNRRQVRQFIDKELRRHPAIAEIIRRDPPFFTSNHAAFLRGGVR